MVKKGEILTSMGTQKANDLLHGVSLARIVDSLVEHYGWEELGNRIKIRCFSNDPSVKSSLKFLRRMPWARKKVEALYITMKKSVWKQDLS